MFNDLGFEAIVYGTECISDAIFKGWRPLTKGTAAFAPHGSRASPRRYSSIPPALSPGSCTPRGASVWTPDRIDVGLSESDIAHGERSQRLDRSVAFEAFCRMLTEIERP
jgi:hypothetical protein